MSVLRKGSLLFCVIVVSAAWLVTPGFGSSGDATEGSLLIFSKTEGFRHASVEAGQDAFTAMAEKHGYSVTVSEESDYVLSEKFPEYDALILLNNDGPIFDDDHQKAIRSYVESGGGVVAIHAASNSAQDWPWYGQLIGARFANHPNDPNVFEAAILTVDPSHPATEMLPERWVREDEWYNFREIPDDVHVLLEMDTDSYEGSDHPGNHPIAWVHENVGGRVFYTALGHTTESYSEELFLEHVWGGLQYVLGEDSR